jgi:hypothetical protein
MPHFPRVFTVSLLTFLALARPLATQAKTFQCAAGDVPCLIAAIHAANANGQANTIRLAAGTYLLTAVEGSATPADANGLPVITSVLTITGRGAGDTVLARDAHAPAFRLMQIAASGTLTMDGLTLQGGAGFVIGGALMNAGTLRLSHVMLTENRSFSKWGMFVNQGTMSVADSAIEHNHEEFVNVFYNTGTLTVTRSTMADNWTPSGTAGITNAGGTVVLRDMAIVNSGGAMTPGVYNMLGFLVIVNSTFTGNRGDFASTITNYGTMSITNATIADNTTAITGYPPTAGVENHGTLTLANTIIARNTAGRGLPPDCAGVITSLGGNLIGDPTGCGLVRRADDLVGDPGLGALIDDGTPGNAHLPLLPTSRAIDAGVQSVCPAKDQLGRRRIGKCDIGAVRFLDSRDRAQDDDQGDRADAR